MPQLRFLIKKKYIYILGGFSLAPFQPSSTSCRHSLSAATVCCCWPKSSSTGAIWGLSGFLKGTTVVFAEGVESIAHSFSTPRHPWDYLLWNLLLQVQVRRRIPSSICDYDAHNQTKKVCVCVCTYAHTSQLPLFSHSSLTVCRVCPTSSCRIMEVDDSHIWSQEMKDIIYKLVSALPLCSIFHTHVCTHPMQQQTTASLIRDDIKEWTFSVSVTYSVTFCYCGRFKSTWILRKTIFIDFIYVCFFLLFCCS